MKMKENSEKAGLKLTIQKSEIMASGPIISWQIDGKLETVADFIFLAPKSSWMVTAATELKMLAPWKQRYDKPKQHFIFLFFFFLLYNIVLVLPYINLHPPRVYTCSPS